MTSPPRVAGAAARGRAEGRLVALLSRKGRFLVAEPFFPQEAAGPGRGRGGRRMQVVVAPARAGRGRGAVGAREGELVLLDLAPGGRARVRRAIGRPDRAPDVIEALMLDRGLSRGFRESLEREARESAPPVRTGPGSGRADLRDLATFTVDPASARDFDDAISAEPLGAGGVRVWVHIADVAAHVREGSALDREALRRSTSVYVPGTVEPMLPEALSGELCSLRPGVDRLAVSVEMDIRAGEPARVAFHRSLIRSDARLEYDQVDRIFAGTERAESPWGEALAAARAAAAQLAGTRAARGALALDSFEPEVAIDAEGGVSVRMVGWSGAPGEALGELRDEPHEARLTEGPGGVVARRRGGGAGGALASSEARRMIEHLMIAANEAVARRLAEHRTPCLYRVHERPEGQRVAHLVAQLASLGVPTPPVPEPMSSSEAAELLALVASAVQAHVAAADARAGHSRGERAARRGEGAGDAREGAGGGGPRRGAGRLALSGLILRSLQQAHYSPRNVGHAGLASAAYCHFTSPIRRYPDLVCHRALLSTLGARDGAPAAAGLGELGAWTSEREREAMEIERDATDVARCFALERELFEEGWERTYEGEVTGLIGAGAFLAFGGDPLAGRLPPYEGMLPVRRLRDWGETGGEEERRAARAAARAQGARRPVGSAGSVRRASGGRGERADGGPGRRGREWWELNEEGTILSSSPSGRTLRLGDAVCVRVRRVEPARGRVDLAPAEPRARR
jgi:ribonuclease R